MLVEIHIGWHRSRTKERKDFCAIFDFSTMDAMVLPCSPVSAQS
jgi:hypothetical protein